MSQTLKPTAETLSGFMVILLANFYTYSWQLNHSVNHEKGKSLSHNPVLHRFTHHHQLVITNTSLHRAVQNATKHTKDLLLSITINTNQKTVPGYLKRCHFLNDKV